MKTPITYYGGKQQLVDVILRMIPKHRIYVEPFFGGGAVFFAKQPSYLEVINDINDNIVTFYRVCQNEALFRELSNMINSTLFSEALYLHAREIWNRYYYVGDVERAWAVWVVTNYSFNATPYGGWKWDNGTKGSHSGVVAANKRNRFTQELFERLQYAQISCRDALDVILQRNTDETFCYLDPPYVGCDQKHYHGYGDLEFKQLLDLLSKNYKGKFMLSTFENDIIAEYVQANNWNIGRVDRHFCILNSKKLGNKKRKTECLIWNYNNEETLF